MSVRTRNRCWPLLGGRSRLLSIERLFKSRLGQQRSRKASSVREAKRPLACQFQTHALFSGLQCQSSAPQEIQKAIFRCGNDFMPRICKTASTRRNSTPTDFCRPCCRPFPRQHHSLNEIIASAIDLRNLAIDSGFKMLAQKCVNCATQGGQAPGGGRTRVFGITTA